MIQISKQHVSTADDLWNARDHSLTSDKLFQAGGFVWNLLQLLRPFSSLHHSQTVQRQRAAATISLMNCRLCIHTNNIEGQIMNSCILSYAKSPEFALERRQASLGKRSAWSALLPGCKCAPAIAKLGNMFPFLNCSQYCPWHLNSPRYMSRDSKNSFRNFSSFSHFLGRYSLCHTIHLKAIIWPPRVTLVPASSWPENTSDTKLLSVTIWLLWSMTYRICVFPSSNVCSLLVVSLCLFEFMQTISYFYLCGIITDSWKYLRCETFTMTSQESYGCFFCSDKLALA